MKKAQLALLLVALAASACHKDKLSSFEQAFEGNWGSVFYQIGTTDHSSEYHADLNLEQNRNFKFTYQWEEGPFSYILTYDQSGKWMGDEAAQKVNFETVGPWSELTANLINSDSLRLTGKLNGIDAALVFVRN